MNLSLLGCIQMLVALALLVFIHELGHFMWARFFKVRVEKFFLFFDIGIGKWDGSLLKFKPKKGDTEYGVGWMPLGGYCKIAGMIDESMDTEQMKQPEQPWEFRSKPTWQRLLIMIGGVLNNFLFAILIFAGIVYYWGEQILPYKNVDLGMAYCASAHKIGFQDGDIPLSADGKELIYLSSDELQDMVTAKQVTVLRNGKDTVNIAIPDNYIFEAEKDAKNGEPFISYRVPLIIDSVMASSGAMKAGLVKGDRICAVDSVQTPDNKSFAQQLQGHKGEKVMIAFLRANKLDSALVEVSKDGMIGISYKDYLGAYYKIETKKYGLLESIPRGIELGWTKLVNYVQQMKYIFTEEGAKSVGGFATIASVFPNTWNWEVFWNMTAFLSLALAFLNILPIPALDGGHVMFLFYEMIFRRKPSEKFLIRAQIVGMMILFALLIWANGNDIMRCSH